MQDEFTNPEIKDALNLAVLPPLDTIRENNKRQVAGLKEGDHLVTLEVLTDLKVSIAVQERSEFAFRIARWVVATQNASLPEDVDAAAVHDAVAEVLAALKRLRPARQQLALIEKAADALRAHLQELESGIVDAVKGLEESTADGV